MQACPLNVFDFCSFTYQPLPKAIHKCRLCLAQMGKRLLGLGMEREFPDLIVCCAPCTGMFCSMPGIVSSKSPNSTQLMSSLR